MYYDEDLLLDIRLNVLNKFVKKFVICEATYNHNGSPKKINFDINKFKKFEDKIIFLKLEEQPDNLRKINKINDNKKNSKILDNALLRENFQRNFLINGIKDSSDEDLILISDLDEIPNLNNYRYKNKISIFKHKMFCYKLNLEYPDFYWIGTKICKKKYLKSPQWLRELKFKKRPFWRVDKLRLNNILENGGWHFCNLKSPKKLLYKYKNVCETNDQFIFKNKISKRYLNENTIKKNIKKRLSIIGRNEHFNAKKLDNSFPSYLIKNKKFYSKWII